MAEAKDIVSSCNKALTIVADTLYSSPSRGVIKQISSSTDFKSIDIMFGQADRDSKILEESHSLYEEPVALHRSSRFSVMRDMNEFGNYKGQTRHKSVDGAKK